MPITIRNYRLPDLENVVVLINAADKLIGEDGTSAEETCQWFNAPNFDPQQNAFIAEDARGRALGYGWVRLVQDAGESMFRSWFAVHPDARGQGVEEQLLARQYARAAERLAECTGKMVNFYTFANVKEQDRIVVLEKFGMCEARRFWQMVCPHLDARAPARFPDGIAMRAYRPQADDERVLAAFNESFRDHWGHAEMPLDEWQYFVNLPYTRHALTLVAEDARSGEIAGFCLNGVNVEENARLGVARGWIDTLGVRRAWRQRGLGTALLLASMQKFRDAGLREAALGADSENMTGATRIYERVGFVVTKTRASYRKAMR